MTSQSASHIRGGYVDIGKYRSQDTRHCYYYNRGTRVLVEGKGRYRSLTRHYCPPPNQGKHVSGDTVVGDGIVGYRSQTSQSSYRRRDSRGDSSGQGIMTEEINHSSLFNFLEAVNGVGKS